MSLAEAPRAGLTGPMTRTPRLGCKARIGFGGRLIVAALLAAAGGCASLPPGSNFPKTASSAYAHPEQTKLGEHFAAAAAANDGKSGFHIIPVGIDGFAVRMQLIKTAERTLDLQYFILRQDQTGSMLTKAVLEAADRGVHVRVLIDDADTVAGDGQIRLLAAHPQIEIRIFNPFIYRGSSIAIRALEFAIRHGRLDFRMHNKLLVVDNAIALIGGRNVGDQYFQIDPNGQYADDDVFVSGPIVWRLSETFDEFWNSTLAIPVEALAGGRPSAGDLDVYRQHLAAESQQQKSTFQPYTERAASGNPLAAILSGELPMVWATADVVYDTPYKKHVEDGSQPGRLIYDAVARRAAAVDTELLMTTPYFVPTSEELALLEGLSARGVHVDILTNSLDSTTELSAQAGYSRYRKPLLRGGMGLHELRAMLGNTHGSGESQKIARHGHYGLHAKLYVFDRSRFFIGSMNFDQRSMRLNTEIGLIIANPELAQQIAKRFAAMTELANAYKVVLRVDAAGKQHLAWLTQEGGRDVEYTSEPSRSVWRSLQMRFLALLPIEHEL